MPDNSTSIRNSIEEHQKIYQIIFDNSPLSIMYTDEKGVITICNESATKLFGAPREKLMGFSYKAINNDQMRTAISTALGGEKSYFEGEYLTVTGNVHTYMRANFSPSFNEDGLVSGVIGIFEDISDRVKAEKSLRELEERFRLAFHTSPDSININKMDGTYVDINEGFTELTGYTRDDVIGRSSKDIRIWETPEDREKLIKGLQQYGFVNSLESKFLMKDGSFKIALLSAKIIMLKGEPHILSVTKDITKLRETEKAHQELQSHVCQVQKLDSIGVLAGGIAHDFNNMLVAILGNIDLALTDLNSDEAPLLLSEAKNASLRAKNLTQQLLTFSKGGDPIKRESSVQAIIEETSNFILRGSKVNCEYSFQKGLHRIEVDSGQISQVIQNITLNAVESMPNGGKVHISCKNFNNQHAGILPLSQGEYVQITIGDNGCGIPKDHIEKIFDPYFTTKQKGSGLGLSLSYSIIAKHKGQIFVKSMQGQGTVFTIYLPAMKHKGQREQEQAVAANTKSHLSILVMDDEEFVRNVSMSMLHHLGHRVILAKNGREAIDLYNNPENDIDLIIMDLTIPGGMGGKAAVQEILKINPNAKVLVSSGYSNDPVMARHRDYGFCGAVIKPFQLQDLSDAIVRMMSG